MKQTTAFAGRTALITGASSGLGVDFAHALAAQGADVILVARREERLKIVADDIRRLYSVKATIVAADLADPRTPEMLHQTLRAQHQVDILVNNAGFGAYGDAIDMEWPRTRDMLQVDINALTELTTRFGRDMRERGWGRILQIASIGGYQPSPSYAAYAAAKAYVLHYGEALNVELRGSGVSCTVLSPGVTATEFLAVSGQQRNWFHRATMMTSQRVVAIGLRAMMRGRGSVVAGWINKLMVFTVRFTPRPLQARLSGFMMRNPE